MLEELRRLSQRLGANPLLVQAAGGNTSLKRDGVMWIKASGTWLQNALSKDIFVPLDMPRLRNALMRDDPACESCTDFVRSEINPLGLRPSIETSVHGLMPQSVVLHVHCVNTIAWAIQHDAERLIAPLLTGLPWAFVPYARPGLQLSRAIRGVVKPDTSVLILQNHGLAVAADSVAQAEALLNDVVQRLQKPVRPFASANLDRLSQIAKDTEYRLPVDVQTHLFAMDAWSHHHAARAVLYPDHAVFLGVALPSDPTSDAAALSIPGAGVLVRKDAKPAIEPMIRCITDVFARLDGTEKLKALTPDEVGALLNWDAEKYRQALKA
jgi:rhamnose utilization protein RhaD (predicted bifunctional aldolase and dehydrogenase)